MKFRQIAVLVIIACMLVTSAFFAGVHYTIKHAKISNSSHNTIELEIFNNIFEYEEA